MKETINGIEDKPPFLHFTVFTNLQDFFKKFLKFEI